MGFFDRLFKGLKKTRESLTMAGEGLFSESRKLDDDFYDELEEILIMADTGVKTAGEIASRLKSAAKASKAKNGFVARPLLISILKEMLLGDVSLHLDTAPSMVLVIGVNGVGKTTTIGKLSARLKGAGKSVLLGAADTFRAAAIDQLEIWADRAEVPIIKQKEGSDPAAVVFDTISAGKARGTDVIICDTAGRLHNKKNLMDELHKITRIIDRELPDGDKEILLVLDATTGQNALNQARQFEETAGITGIILTKLDGTAKGGVVIAITNELSIPIKYIGVGEQVEDLQPFDSEAFVDALFDTGEEAAKEEGEWDQVEQEE